MEGILNIIPIVFLRRKVSDLKRFYQQAETVMSIEKKCK